jgi:hypothetical protein
MSSRRLRPSRTPDRLTLAYQLLVTLFLCGIVAAALLTIGQGFWQRSPPTPTPTLNLPSNATLAPVIITQILPPTPEPTSTATPPAP